MARRRGWEPDVVLPTPWYPTRFNPMAGSFVADHARLVAQLRPRVEVVHGQEWPGGDAETSARLRPDVERLLGLMTGRLPAPEGALTRLPVMITAGMSVPERAEAFVRTARPIEAPVVHGHVGYLGGLVAARLADPAARVIATEHSSGLAAHLADPQGREQYAEVLARVERLLCVSGRVRDLVVEAFPDHAAVVEVMPNPVDFSGRPSRPTPTSLDRWVFVGNLNDNKGILRLAQAFVLAARSAPALSLTVFGDGPLREQVLDVVRAGGVADRVELRGVVPHADLLAELPSYDLLVGPSRAETFHLAVVEAVAAGVPVVVTRSGGPQEALAGVEDRVGRFVDVADTPDELVDAWRDLSRDLGSLDLAGARAELDARYGLQAALSRLRTLYGDQPRTRPAPLAVTEPDRVVLLAASAQRRYAVKADLAALAASGVPARLVATDAELTALAQELGVEVTPSYLAMRQPAAPPAPPWHARLRRAVGRVLGRPGPTPRPDPFGLDAPGAGWLLVTDCHSAPHAVALAARYPSARVVVDLPVSP